MPTELKIEDTSKEMEVQRRNGILQLQEQMMAYEDKLDIDKDFPLTHHFAPGVYGREILLPKNTVIIGKIHKHAHLNIISKGKVMVITEFGYEEFVGPYTFVSKPGTKRVVAAIEDTIWTTIHLTDKTDLVEIEEDIIAKSFDEYFLFLEQERMKLENKV